MKTTNDKDQQEEAVITTDLPIEEDAVNEPIEDKKKLDEELEFLEEAIAIPCIDEILEELHLYKSEREELKKKMQIVEAMQKSFTVNNTKLNERIVNFEKEREQYKLDLAIKKEKQIEEIAAQNDERIELYKKRIRQLEEENKNKEAVILDIEKLKFEKDKLMVVNDELKTKVIDLQKFKTNYEIFQQEMIDVENLKTNYRELQKKVDVLIKYEKELQEARLELDEKKFEIDRLKSDNHILTNKVLRLVNRLKELEAIEREKTTDYDKSLLLLKEIINSEENDKISFKRYIGDERASNELKEFMKKAEFLYDEKNILGFLAAIKSSPFCILKGLSGTGKSSLPKLFSYYLGAHCEIIPVQPNWKTKQDLMGFYNYFTHKFEPTEFTKTLLRANVNRNKIFIIVLDEMNLARVEYYFSELNSKLWAESNDQNIELYNGNIAIDEQVGKYIIDGNKIRIPSNVIFVGTINEDDSVSPISDKIYDRAQVIDFIPTPNKVAIGDLDAAKENVKLGIAYGFDSFINVEVNEETTNRAMDIIVTLNKFIREKFNKNLGYRSMDQIRRFITVFTNAGGNEYDALDLQLVSKIIPKIKYSFSTTFDKKLGELENEIRNTFKTNYRLKDDVINELEIIKQIKHIKKEIEV